MRKKKFIKFLTILCLFTCLFSTGANAEFANQIDIKYMTWDDQLLSNQHIVEGESYQTPLPPMREGYEFVAWELIRESETELVFKAKYAKLAYQVVFKDDEGNVLSTQSVPYGESATAPQWEEVNGKTFKGWDKDISSVKENTIVTAIVEYTKYTVRFLDATDNVISTQTVTYNQAAIPPKTNPTKDGYVFAGWIENYKKVQSNLDVHPYFTKDVLLYVVNFYDSDGTLLSSQKVEAGKDANPPEVTSKDGINFSRWSQDYKSVTSNIDTYAIYDNQFIIYFMNADGTSVFKTVIVNKGESIESLDSAPTKEGYTFSKWDKDLTNISSDLIVNPIFVSGNNGNNNNTDTTTKTYTVTFVDYDNDVIDKQTVKEGKDANPPSDPKRSGYRFKSWSGDYTNVTEDRTIKARYKKKDSSDEEEYTVKFYGKDGELLKTETVEEGEDASAPSVPKLEGYTFKRWSKNFESVESDLKVEAIYVATTDNTNKYSGNDSSTDFENTPTVNIVASVPTGSTLTNSTPTKSNKTSTANQTTTISENQQKYTTTTSGTKSYSNTESSSPNKTYTSTNSSETTSDTDSVDSSVEEKKTETDGVDYSDVYAQQEALKSAGKAVKVDEEEEVNEDENELEEEEEVSPVEDGPQGYYPLDSEDLNEDVESQQVLAGDVEEEDSNFLLWLVVGTGIAILVLALISLLILSMQPKKIKFFNDDGELLSIVKVKKGKDCEAVPNAPNKEGYEFIEWDTNLNSVQSDLEVRPIYKKKK